MYTYIQHVPSLSLYNLIKIWVYNLKDCFCRLFLKAGITRAIFHVDGNMPFCNEKLKIIAKGIQMVSEVLLNIWWVMPSSPQALPIFNVCKISLISCSVIYILDNNASVLFKVRPPLTWNPGSAPDIFILFLPRVGTLCRIFYHERYQSKRPRLSSVFGCSVYWPDWNVTIIFRFFQRYLKWQPKRCFNADGKYVLRLLNVVIHEPWHQFKRKGIYCKFHFDKEAHTKPKNVRVFTF